MEVTTVGTPLLWGGFTIFILAMLVLDLGVFHRKAHEVTMREAAAWSVVWVALAMAFCAGVHQIFGADRGFEFLTGYLIEKALAVDNIFVFLVLFSSFAVPATLQHKVLFWGVLGALLMRALFIFAGAALLSRFHWLMYVFGAFLLLTGIKLLVQRHATMHPENNPVFRMFRRLIPSVPDYDGDRFIVVRNGRRYATPLLLVLLCIETADLIFALDSIPAIFAVTVDPFIVFTSNIFAILGLRAMFFLLAGVIEQVRYLKVGLAVVLAFVGTKMLLIDLYKIPIGWSLGFIAAVLGLSVLLSWLLPLLRSRLSRLSNPAYGLSSEPGSPSVD